MNTIIINQFFGAGDIIFCQTIVNRLRVQYNAKILWPVQDVYAPLAKHFPNITMVDKALVSIDYSRRDEYEFNGTKVIPLRFTDSICNVPYTDCMKSKYGYFGWKWEDWKSHHGICRDGVKESQLMNELGLNDGVPYNLISDMFQTGGTRTISITPPDNGFKNVYMKFIEGYTIIDWLTVMQQAETIHAVSSANIYLFELFPPKAIMNLYIRRPNEQNHDNYSYLLTKDKYILHP